MKVLITFISLLCFCADSHALASITNVVNHRNQSSYDIGYNAGKNHAYNNVMKTVTIVWIATVAGVIIYHAGKESRWTMTDEGNIGYRF